MKALLALAAVMAWLGGSGALPSDVEVDAVREATFRHMFRHNLSGLQGDAKVYCLAIASGKRRSDPSEVFIARFADVRTPVRPASGCSQSHKGVFDSMTGERGLFFTLGAVRWREGGSAEVDGSYWETILSSSVNTYYLSKRDGRWTVVKDVTHSVT